MQPHPSRWNRIAAVICGTARQRGSWGGMRKQFPDLVTDIIRTHIYPSTAPLDEEARAISEVQLPTTLSIPCTSPRRIRRDS